MSTITAAMVEELREKTGAGMMDCKKALAETNGDIEARSTGCAPRGIAKADKKSGRAAAEGLVGIASNGTKAVVIELNSETDFVARNDAFQDLVRGVAAVAVGTDGSVETIQRNDLSGNRPSRSLKASPTRLQPSGENMALRRSALLSVEDGVVATYRPQLRC